MILKKNKFVFLVILLLAILYSMVFAADWIAPYDPIYQNPEAGYAAPSKIHFDFKNGLYIYATKYELNQTNYKKETIEIKDTKYKINFFTNKKLFAVKEPAYLYLLGADRLGRDLFSRLVHGSKPSLCVGFIGLLISLPIGLIYGGISGFWGGYIDNLMMRFAELIISLPSFYLLIILSAILPANLTNIQRFMLITFILSFISWASLSRIIRGQIISIKSKEFIEAAQALGQNKFMIVLKHLLPQTLSFTIVLVTVSIPGFIIGESALSFLGLGINQPDPSWGNILAEGKDLSNIITRPILIWAPSILIFLTVFCFNYLGDFLRDYFDPKL